MAVMTCCRTLRKLWAFESAYGNWPRIRDEDYSTIERLPSFYNPLHSYRLEKGGDKHYQQQYGDMYFLRLAKLKPAVEEIAAEAWDNLDVHKPSWPQNYWWWLTVSDSWRDCTPCGSSAWCTPRRALLGSRNRLHGYALEAQYSRWYFQRCASDHTLITKTPFIVV